jgi:hypothetical protein
MDVVGHDDEGVEFDAILVALLLKDFYEEKGVLFDLEESTAGGGGACDEVGSEFLWSSWHGEEGPGAKAPFKAELIRGAKAPSLIPKSESNGKNEGNGTAKATTKERDRESAVRVLVW